jgi:uncharacterized delta-60 repeat protein
LCALLLVAWDGSASAAPGDLDPTFGGDGIVTANFGGYDSALAVAIQRNGKIVVGGCGSLSFPSCDFGLARFNLNGSRDTTFDGDGLVTTDFGSAGSIVRGLAIQADGKIVAAGDTIFVDIAVARYNVNGTLDTSFDGDGVVMTDIGGSETTAGVAIQADGKIVVAGYTDVNWSTSNDDFVLARYNPDGTLDGSFGTGGIVITDFGLDSDQANGLGIQPNGKIVVAGCTSCYGGVSGVAGDFALARYDPDGALDAAFDGDGLVVTDFRSGNDDAFDLAFQPGGRIVAGGCVDCHFEGNPEFSDLALARYKSNGTLDTSFDMDGKVTTDLGDSDVIVGLAPQPDGKLVVVGNAPCCVNPVVGRYGMGGSLDGTFGTGGIVLLPGLANFVSDVALHRNGRIVVVGEANLRGDFLAARLLA